MPNSKPLQKTPTMSANPVTAVAAFAISKGIPLASITEATGLELAALVAPSARLPESVMPRLFRVLAEHFPGEAFTLELASTAPADFFGELKILAATAPDLRALLQVGCENARLLSTQLEMSLSPVHGGERLGFLHPNDDLEDGLGAEVGVAVTARLIREILGFPDALLRVELRQQPFGPLEAYREFFQCPVEFPAERNGLVFRRSAMSFPINPHARAHYRAALTHLKFARQEFKSTDEPEALLIIRDAIAQNATSGEYNADALARSMGIGLRTLQRRVTSLGTSLRALIDEVRSENARTLLGDPELSIYEVALMLGYSTESAFRRAFQRWHKQSPTQYRQWL